MSLQFIHVVAKGKTHFSFFSPSFNDSLVLHGNIQQLLLDECLSSWSPPFLAKLCSRDPGFPGQVAAPPRWLAHLFSLGGERAGSEVQVGCPL